MTDFKTMTKKTTPMTMPKKMLAGAATVVALSGFVPVIEAASPTATANVGAEVVIQQAITVSVTKNISFGTLIMTAATIAGWATLYPDEVLASSVLGSAMSFAGTRSAGAMNINASAGDVNIAIGAKVLYDNGNIDFYGLLFGGAAIIGSVAIAANANASINLIGSTLDIGVQLHILTKPTPGSYTGSSYVVTVTDI